ncbi:CU044_5270 family protein [Streptomyces sp. 142MFCol3.1]|uniref:CU044_5270 family protein n=1 Tax=Streptomyces sp. 142MFCol3.1 TaxID=1172179 RepID=UPI000408EB45|nr:CU044_5270 family protein [Streptomyces sp. 142MFCol3.1]
MNAKTAHDGFDATESAERADAARMLPTPAARDLPDDRLRVLKEHLLSEIRQSVPATAPEAAADAVTAPRRRRRRWVPVVAPLAAAAVAAAVLITGVDHHGRHPDTVQSAPSKASTLLENAAAVVSREPAVKVGHHQYVYIRSVSAGRDNPLQAMWTDKHGHVHKKYSKTAGKLTKLQTLREWIPWSRSQGGAQAYGDKAPERFDFPGPGEGTVGGPGHTQSPFEDLAGLPRDPAAAIRAIEADWRRQMENAENTKGNMRPAVSMPWVFEYLGGMLQESVDPQTTAFLYRAAAQIPGTRVIPDAVDAVGRHGVAITLDGQAEDRQEWIFDKSTYAFLGFRDVTREDTVIGKAGSVIQTTAVLQRAVVDRVGEEPHKKP